MLQLATGLPVAEFTAHTAYRILTRLDFDVVDQIAQETLTVESSDQDGQSLDLLVTFETDEDGWIVVSCPTLPGCHSQGRTRNEALTNIQEAIGGYLANMLEHDEPIPYSTDFTVLKVRI